MKKVFLLFSFSLLVLAAPAQALTGFFNTLSLQTPAQPRYNLESSTYTPLAASFWFYKTLISSQDGNTCPFEISCSRYTVESINRMGIVEGLLNGLDRLQRCNGFSNDHYHRNVSGRLTDPVEW